MSPKRNLIPSKDALRALRSLALSPPLAFIGTVGSVCGLVGVHYQGRQKLQLATKILETKKTIHSLSQGRGIAQLNRMFEAAENGEDFVIHHGRPMKAQRGTNLDAVTARSRDENRRDGKGFDVAEPAEIMDNQPKHIPIESAPELPRVLRSDVNMHIKKPRRGSLPLRWQDDLNNEQTFPKDFRSAAYAALRARQERKRQSPLASSQWSGAKPNRSSKLTPELQEITDLNPPSDQRTLKMEDKQSDKSDLLPEESVFFNYVFGKESQEDAFASNTFKSMLPWDSAGFSQSTPRVAQPNVEETIRVQPVAYLPVSEQVPERNFSHTLSSSFSGKNISREARRNLRKAGETRYHFLFNNVAQILQDYGVGVALPFLEQTLQPYVLTSCQLDLKLCQMLLHDFSNHFSINALDGLVEKLVHLSLTQEVPGLHSVALLYSLIGRNANRISNITLYRRASVYLQNACSSTSGLQEQKTLVNNVIAGTEQCGLKLHEQLWSPMLRRLCGMGKVDNAQAIVEELSKQWHIPTSMFVSSILMRGYASAGNTWKVKAMLQESHADGDSWKRVHTYANRFAFALDEYAVKHTLEQTCDFVMDTVKNAGLIPTSVISTRVIVACVRQRRYDLLRQYINMVQNEFPYIEVGTKNAPFALAIAETWKGMQASFKDILHGCRAIAVNSIREPFSKTFRGMVSDIVISQFNDRISTLEATLALKTSIKEPNCTITACVENVRRLIKHHYQAGFSPESKALAESLIKETKTMMAVDELLAGRWVEDPEVESSNRNSSSSGPVKSIQNDLPRLPPGLRAQRLPPMEQIFQLMKDFYESRYRNGFIIEHSVLIDVCSRLSQQMRHYDAYSLLEAVHNSEWAQEAKGLPYDAQLFAQWLQYAFSLRHATKVRHILWQAVEAGPELAITSDFLLQVRIATPRTHFNRKFQASDAQLLEAYYLTKRLRRRRAQEASLKGRSPMMLSSWKAQGKS